MGKLNLAWTACPPHSWLIELVREAQELNKIAVQMRIPQMQIRIVYLDWLEAALVRENPQIVASYNHRMQRQLAKEREPKRKALEVAKKALIKKSSKYSNSLPLGGSLARPTRCPSLKPNAKPPELVASYEKGRQDFVADFDTDGYHMFRDFTGFAYDITLSRPSPGDNQNELWILKVSLFSYNSHVLSVINTAQGAQMYESDSEPMKFASCAHHLGPGLSIKKEILAFNGSDYAQAFGEFEKKFREIMKRSFYDRLGSVDRNLTEFSYVRPGKGEPTGTLKPGETFATLIRY